MSAEDGTSCMCSSDSRFIAIEILFRCLGSSVSSAIESSAN